MAEGNIHISSFNRGVVSPRAMGRVDVEKLRMVAEEQENLIPDALGNGIFRPGTQYTGETRDNARCRMIEFIRSADDSATIEMTPNHMRVWVNVQPNDRLVTRPIVATVVANSGFNTPGTGWTVEATGGAIVDFDLNQLRMRCPARGGKVRVWQEVAVAVGDRNKLHALRMQTVLGRTTFRVGTYLHGDDLVRTTMLRTGTHSIAFYPPGNFWIEYESQTEAARQIDMCVIEQPGTIGIGANNGMEIVTPYSEADLPNLRWTQSADVVFLACRGHHTMRIERRPNDSWSFCNLDFADGPFTTDRTRQVRMKCEGFTGNQRLVTDAPFFRPGHVGALFRLFHTGQETDVLLGRDDTWSEVIRVFGYTDPERTISFDISGTFTGKIWIQRSFDSEDFGFTDVVGGEAPELPITGPLSGNFHLGDAEGTPMWVRIGIKPTIDGDATTNWSGQARVRMWHTGGGGFGIARVLSLDVVAPGPPPILSETVAHVEIMRPMRRIVYTERWREGQWSGVMGWPTVARLQEGRLWLMNLNHVWGSVSDVYESFDEEKDGDAAPLNRTIGEGAVDEIYWLLGLQRLIAGNASAEVSIRSTSFDEPITVEQYNSKDASTIGSANVDAVKVDQDGFFIARDGHGIYTMAFARAANDYQGIPVDTLVPEIGDPLVVRMAVQRHPETRVWIVRSDGKAAMLTFVPGEEIWRSFVVVSTFPGVIEDVCVLPGDIEDRVYFIVRRFDTLRYREVLAPRPFAENPADIRIADSHALWFAAEGAPGQSVIPGFFHLRNHEVVVWADGQSRGVHTITAEGNLVLSFEARKVMAGLYYKARYKSAKLAYGAGRAGTALNQVKKVEQLGLVLHNTHSHGVRYGRDFDHLEDLPQTFNGKRVEFHDFFANRDQRMTSLAGSWDSDSRLCLQMDAPLPCTVLSLVLKMDTEER